MAGVALNFIFCTIYYITHAHADNTVGVNKIIINIHAIFLHFTELNYIFKLSLCYSVYYEKVNSLNHCNHSRACIIFMLFTLFSIS